MKSPIFEPVKGVSVQAPKDNKINDSDNKSVLFYNLRNKNVMKLRKISINFFHEIQKPADEPAKVVHNGEIQPR